ncbi:hypothetical protein Syun_009215 [Stephania yunnanensis]|uniref:Uncharacterized protein n=1 Tax=Stephania yunnanensis TaxID=152371 RepID=A0AAP0KE03_9MAGN
MLLHSPPPLTPALPIRSLPPSTPSPSNSPRTPSTPAMNVPCYCRLPAAIYRSVAEEQLQRRTDSTIREGNEIGENWRD